MLSEYLNYGTPMYLSLYRCFHALLPTLRVYLKCYNKKCLSDIMKIANGQINLLQLFFFKWVKKIENIILL